MSFQSLLLFCLCFTAFVSQLFLMHDFCCRKWFCKASSLSDLVHCRQKSLQGILCQSAISFSPAAYTFSGPLLQYARSLYSATQGHFCFFCQEPAPLSHPMISFFCARSLTPLKALQGMKSVKIEAIQGVSEADTSRSICFVKPLCFLLPPKHRSKTLSSNGEGPFCQFNP